MDTRIVPSTLNIFRILLVETALDSNIGITIDEGEYSSSNRDDRLKIDLHEIEKKLGIKIECCKVQKKAEVYAEKDLNQYHLMMMCYHSPQFIDVPEFIHVVRSRKPDLRIVMFLQDMNRDYKTVTESNRRYRSQQKLVQHKNLAHADSKIDYLPYTNKVEGLCELIASILYSKMVNENKLGDVRAISPMLPLPPINSLLASSPLLTASSLMSSSSLVSSNSLMTERLDAESALTSTSTAIPGIPSSPFHSSRISSSSTIVTPGSTRQQSNRPRPNVYLASSIPPAPPSSQNNSMFNLFQIRDTPINNRIMPSSPGNQDMELMQQAQAPQAVVDEEAIPNAAVPANEALPNSNQVPDNQSAPTQPKGLFSCLC